MNQHQWIEHLSWDENQVAGDAYKDITRRPEMRGMDLGDLIDEYSSLPSKTIIGYEDEGHKAFNSISSSPIYGVRATNDGDGWNRYKVGADLHAKESPRYKQYITLDRDAGLKLTADETKQFLSALFRAGFSGQCWFPEKARDMLFRYDNIVLHGATKADCAKAKKVAEDFFGSRIKGTDVGIDADIGGKHYSNNEVNAMRVKRNARKNQGMSYQDLDDKIKEYEKSIADWEATHPNP